MFIDFLLDGFFGLLEWLLSLLPPVPSSLPALPDAVSVSLSFIDRWIDVRMIADAFMGVTTVLSLLLTWAAINWAINKVRGSG